MKILVCISKTPDTTAKIAFTDNNTKFDSNNVQFIINPYDEWYALVRALELKEANGGTVTVIHVGGADTEPIIRKALAVGADDAVRIDAEPKDAYFVANQIANYAQKESFDIIFAGKETLDFNGGEVGAMIAANLDYPFVSFVGKLDMNGNEATMEREIEGGKEVVNVSTPFVLSAQKGMAEQRIPNMRGIMAARTKPLKVEAATDSEALVAVSNFELPEAKSECKYVDADNAAELINLLRNEAKVI